MKKRRIEWAVRELLVGLGQDPESDGLRGTPDRVARSWVEMLSGYEQDPIQVMKCTDGADGFDQEYDGMVVLSGIPFTSTCEHHLLPFIGTADVGYIPNPVGKVVGLSKLARLVDVYARRLQLQERLTSEIAVMLEQATQASGVGVRVRSVHQCMVCRGVRKAGVMATEVLLGCFRDGHVRSEFWNLCGE